MDTGQKNAAQALEGLLEVGQEALVIVVAQLAQAVSGLGAQLLGGVVRKDRALEGIQEANAEVMAVARGDLRVGAGDADGGDVGIREILGAGDGDAGAVGAQHHGNARGDQLLRGGGSLIGGGAVVRVDQLHIVGGAADLNGGGLLVGVLHAQHLLLAARATVAGGRLKHADLHGLGHGRRGKNQHHCHYNRKYLFHRNIPPIIMMKTLYINHAEIAIASKVISEIIRTFFIQPPTLFRL